VKLYVGQTRDGSLIAELQALGVGECTNRGELPPRRLPWFLDNGAYTDFKSKKPFDLNRWIRDTRHIMYRLESDEWPVEMAPDFTVVPDLVGGGKDSLDFSIEHLFRIESLHVPHYLAVQNGMTKSMVRSVLPQFGGVFVGGTLDWKLETMAMWSDMAHDAGLLCHVGRIGTIPRVEMAKQAGVDSIDSCQPLWTRARLGKFVEAVMGPDGSSPNEASTKTEGPGKAPSRAQSQAEAHPPEGD